MNRRRYLAATGGIIALAGCSDDDPDDESEPEDADTPTETQEDTSESPESSGESDDTEERIEPEILELSAAGIQNDRHYIRPFGDSELNYAVRIPAPEERYNASIAIQIEDGDSTIFETASELEGDSDQSQIEIDGVIPVEINEAPTRVFDLIFELHDEVTDSSVVENIEILLDDWEQSLILAENELQRSFEGYAHHVEEDDATILDVMMSVEYTHSEAQPPNGRAIGHIDDARFAVDQDSDERELVLQYQSEARSYADLMRYQRKHGDLYNIFDEIYTVIDEEEPDVETIDPPTDTHNEREEEFEELMEEFEDVDPVVGELYDEKMTQLERELDIANEIITGINYILDPGFGTQQERAALAKNTFRTVASQIEDPDDYPPTNQTDGDLVELVNEWEELAEEIEQELRIL